MPWSETSTMDQKIQFIADYLREVLSITELCELYGISRKTGYKWIDRYIHNGPAGLEEYSRRPHQTPNQTDPEITGALLEIRRRHPTWGQRNCCLYCTRDTQAGSCQVDLQSVPF